MSNFETELINLIAEWKEKGQDLESIATALELQLDAVNEQISQGGDE